MRRVKNGLFCLILLGIAANVINTADIQSQCLPVRMDNRSEIVQTNFGFPMFIDRLDRGISEQIFSKKQHNRDIINFLLNHLSQKNSKDNFNIIHVGAHVGTETLAMAKYISEEIDNNNKINIFAFEPQPYSFMLLQKSVYFNNFQHIVKVLNVGVSSKQSEGQLAVKFSDVGSSQILQVASTKRRAEYKLTVPLIPLFSDSSNAEQNQKTPHIPIEELQKTTLIYINTNSMQIQILGGLIHFFQQNKQNPDLSILVKWNYGNNPMKYVQLLSKFLEIIQSQQIGYSISQIINLGETNEVKYRQIRGFRQLVSLKQGWVLFKRSVE